MSPIPPNSTQVTQTPAIRNARSFTTDSTATAERSPRWACVKSGLRAPNRMPNTPSTTATSRVGSKSSRIVSWWRISLNDWETAWSWSAMYGIRPTTTSPATRAPSGADFPYRLEMKSEMDVIRCSLATRTSRRRSTGQRSAMRAGPR